MEKNRLRILIDMSEDLEEKTETSFIGRTTEQARDVYVWSKKHVNYKIGLMGAVGAGTIAFYSNYEHGFTPAALAFGKQAVFALGVGGYNTRLCEKIAVKFKSKTVSVVASSIVPTILTGVALYGYHKLLLTPEAFNTALNISITNLPAFLALGWYFRRNHDRGVKGVFQ